MEKQEELGFKMKSLARARNGKTAASLGFVLAVVFFASISDAQEVSPVPAPSATPAATAPEEQASPPSSTSTAAPSPAASASAQMPTVEQLKSLKQNPVSGLRQVVIEANVSPNLPITGKTQGVYSVQPVWPFRLNEDWRLITYTILPVVQQAGPPGQTSIVGLGDTLVNLFVSPAKLGSFVWGAGATILLPTRTDSALGSDRGALGPALVLFWPTDKLSAGVVLQNGWSFGGSGVNRVDAFGAQYLLNYSLRKGWYLYSNATITSDWTADPRDRWTVPVGGGAGNIFVIGTQPVSLSLEAFANVVTPRNGPTWSTNLQFSFLFPTAGQSGQ